MQNPHIEIPTLRDVYQAKKTIAPHFARTPSHYSAGEVTEPPLHEDEHTVLELHELHDVHEQPQQPRGVAREAKTAQIGHGRGASDHREAALVPIVERRWRSTGQPIPDHARDVTPLLDRHGRDPG